MNGVSAIHIIGCGTIGSNLALEIAKTKIIKNIHIYDGDHVTYTDKSYFPFVKDVMGMRKVEATSLLFDGLLLNDSVTLFSNFKTIRVLKKYENELYIDCRDTKNVFLDCDIRLSMDGPVLIIDSSKQPNNNDYNQYTLEKDPLYIQLGISICVNYILRGLWKCGQFKLFDMRSLLYSSKDIIT